MGRVWPAPRGRRLPYSRCVTAPAPARVTAPRSPPHPGTLTRGFEIRAGVTVLIQDAEGVS